MRIPLDWLKEYIKVDLTPREIGEAFTAIGLMTDKPFDGKAFDLEHRFDRSDWLSILGCARDLAAYLETDLVLPQVTTAPGKEPSTDQIVEIKVECPEIVRRFNTRVFRNIKVKESPDWLKNRLIQYGIPSINNIVDITNYVMVELGQPMHAQDLKKLRKQEIVIRKAREGEKLVTFLGDEVKIPNQAFVLTQNNIPTVLGGIVGGKETGVDESTRDIVLDAGNYDHAVIRKVSRAVKIQNETVSRYDKFLSPQLTQYAIQRAAQLILELAGGEYYQNVDWNPHPVKPVNMTLTKSRLQKISGMEFINKQVERILNCLGYQIVRQTESTFELIIPYFRTDIEVEDDVVSDILRINGYNKIPATCIQSAPPQNITPAIYTFEDKLRDTMITLGAHEHITDPLVSSTQPLEQRIILGNSQNSQKNALRISIAETLEAITLNYTKNRILSGILFEIGKIYLKPTQEERRLECLVFDQTLSPKELYKKASETLMSLFKNLEIGAVALKKSAISNTADICVGSVVLGHVKYNGFTLSTVELLKVKAGISRVVTEIQIPNYTETSFLTPKNLSVGEIINQLSQASPDILKVEFVEEYTGLEIAPESRSVLIRTYFKPQIKADTEGVQIIDKTLLSLNLQLRR